MMTSLDAALFPIFNWLLRLVIMLIVAEVVAGKAIGAYFRIRHLIESKGEPDNENE